MSQTRSTSSKGASVDRLKAHPEGNLPPSIAHEINNPIQSLLNLLCLVEAEEGLSETGRQYLSLAKQEANRVSLITRAAMNPTQEDTSPNPINLSRLLASVIEFYKSRLESRGLLIHTRYVSDSDLCVLDDGSLRQAFANLLTNAADATARGGRIYARVVPAFERAGRKRHGLRVTIADTGSGISTDDVRKIWDPFFTTKGSSGTGIGLSLVCNTVEKLGGTLRVRTSTSKGRSGTVFSLFLPQVD
jgi:signal transduction histidine kinase